MSGTRTEVLAQPSGERGVAWPRSFVVLPAVIAAQGAALAVLAGVDGSPMWRVARVVVVLAITGLAVWFAGRASRGGTALVAGIVGTAAGAGVAIAQLKAGLGTAAAVAGVVLEPESPPVWLVTLMGPETRGRFQPCFPGGRGTIDGAFCDVWPLCMRLLGSKLGFRPRRRLGVIVMAAAGAYPVRVDASLDSPLSRWLWLVKWVLVIPHYFVLAFLWLAFVVLSVVAFFAILFTGRYPRGIFEFNVGVLRWTWRVQYYAIGGFGTDRYPPFTLADDPGYPAHLEIDYPARLSRGLVLVKWWLLAIPQYIIVGVFTGSGVWFAWQYGRTEANWAGIGLIGILALIAAVVLLVTGEYPRQIFDFVLGMNRWVLRVAAYAGLMTDAYPPFRLDMGGHEPGGTLTVPPPATGVEGAPWQPEQAAPAEPTPAGPGPSGPGPGAGRPPGWTAGRIVSVVIGAVLVLCSLGLLGGGAGALWATTVHRSGGYVDLGTQTYRTTGHALASRQIELYTAAGGWDVARSLFGTVRLRVNATEGTPVFAGIARAGAADRYLSGMAYATVTGTTRGHPSYLGHAGGAPAVLPARAGIWTVKAAGPGTQTLVWQVANGRWTVVAMNADATAPVSVRVNAAATLPALPWVATGLLIAGGVFLLAGVLLIAFPLRGASRQHTTP